MAYGEKYEETPKQKEQFRLWSAMYQIENIRKLTENNEYKQFIHAFNHLPSTFNYDTYISYMKNLIIADHSKN